MYCRFFIKPKNLGFFNNFPALVTTLASCSQLTHHSPLVQYFSLGVCQLSNQVISDKKFEVMLTRHVKAYSSFCLQTVSLSPAIS